MIKITKKIWFYSILLALLFTFLSYFVYGTEPCELAFCPSNGIYASRGFPAIFYSNYANTTKLNFRLLGFVIDVVAWFILFALILFFVNKFWKLKRKQKNKK